MISINYAFTLNSHVDIDIIIFDIKNKYNKSINDFLTFDLYIHQYITHEKI